MIDFLYTLFIAPLEYWMHKALLWGFEMTQQWGWAIIVMSLNRQLCDFAHLHEGLKPGRKRSELFAKPLKPKKQ